jgi:hypothetical protein
MRTAQLLTLALLATAANASTLDITFNRVATIELQNGMSFPQIFFTGVIVTDGTCTNCSIVQNSPQDIVRDGIDSISIPLGPGIEWGLGGPLDGEFFGNVDLNVVTDTLTGSIATGDEFLVFGETLLPANCPPEGPCPSGPGSYFFSGGGDVNEWGTFTVSPEPSSWVLLGAFTITVATWRLMRRSRSQGFIFERRGYPNEATLDVAVAVAIGLPLCPAKGGLVLLSCANWLGGYRNSKPAPDCRT